MLDPVDVVVAWFKDNPILKTEFLARAEVDQSDAEDWFFDWIDAQMSAGALYRLIKDLVIDTVDYYGVFLELEVH